MRKNGRNKKELRKAMMPTGRKIALRRKYIENFVKNNNYYMLNKFQ